jgi:ketosteroid isomerase-like protein
LTSFAPFGTLKEFFRKESGGPVLPLGFEAKPVVLEEVVWRKLAVAAGCAFVFAVMIAAARPDGISDDEGRVMALENAWNHALEAKDTSALDMLFGDTLVAVDIDGSLSNKWEYLASIKAPDFQPGPAVNELMKVHMYGETAIPEGIFRIKGTDKGKPYVHRERTIDTRIKTDGTWKCVSAVAVEIPAKAAANEQRK